MIHTPVALLVFNRPRHTAKVFEIIRQVRPAQLLIVADGPRADRADDISLCQDVRTIVSKIDWSCEILRNYADTNLGCKKRVSSGLDWVFETFERAIILEDDCLPVPSFFAFCEELLERYKNDTRIMQVCGNNLAGPDFMNDLSYAFSKIGPIWGWASWRRAWKYYDVEMKMWPQIVKEKLYTAFWDLSDEVRFRFPLYQKVYDNDIDTWDIQWGFAKIINAGLSVIPKENLISNIGFDDGSESTHTVGTHSPLANITRHEISFPLRHPNYVIRNKHLEETINDMLSGKMKGHSQRETDQKVDSHSFNIKKPLPPLKVGLLTSRGVNVGDEFIREGVRAILDKLNIEYTPMYVHKLSESSLHIPDDDEVVIVNDKYWDSDLFIQCGAPVYWHLLEGHSTSLNSEWHRWMWEERILNNTVTQPVFINLGAGSCQPWGDSGEAFLNDPECVLFARDASTRSSLTTVRDPVAEHLLNVLKLPHEALPCPAFLAACRHKSNVSTSGVIGINLMQLGGHYDLSGNMNVALWEKQCFTLVVELRKISKLIFIAHDKKEAEFMAKYIVPGERIYRSENWRDYFDVYSACKVIVANRVHGAVCAAGFGVPSIILGNDTRAMIGDYVNIPRYHVRDLDVTQIIQKVHTFIEEPDIERSRLLEIRNKTINEYKDLLFPIVEQVNISRQQTMTDKTNQFLPSLALASVSEIHSEVFQQCMQCINAFASQLSLRTFTNWSKVWEYPWLWLHGLSDIKWPNIQVLDIGSEISPMPWFWAALGANVTLIETDRQWIAVWNEIKNKTGLCVDWKILTPHEKLPFTDRTFDLVTSFSVIEHQPNKIEAIAEVVRVLKPGGVFALSFDICEPEMGMTFPEWNGRALTMREFENIVWNHPEFMNTVKPNWNIEDIPAFRQWHLQSAPHHNYTVGAAVLRKKT